jgi:tetratricopeptide (TPR) repeat protein
MRLEIPIKINGIGRVLGVLTVSAGVFLGASLVPKAAAAGLAELKAEANKTPSSAESGIELAVQLRHAGLPMEAQWVLNKSLGKTTDAALITRISLEKARVEIERGRMKQALAECEKMKKGDQVVYHTCAAEAYLLFRRGSLALPEAEAALNLKPGDYDATLAKGRALWIQGNADAAYPVLNDLIKGKSQEGEGYPYLAELLIGTGKNDEAVKLLRKGLQVAPKDARLHVMLAKLLPPGDEAAKHFKEATQLRHEYFDAYAGLGRMQLQLRQLDDAEKSLRKALTLNTKDAETLAALAEVFLLRPNLEEALKQARAALKILPSNGPAKLIEAEALAAKGDIDLAIEEYQAAYGLQRRNPDVLIRAARACAKHGRPTTAVAFAERATDDFPESGPAFDALGDVLVANGDKPAAKVAYAEAVKKSGPAEAAAIKKKIAALK